MKTIIGFFIIVRYKKMILSFAFAQKPVQCCRVGGKQQKGEKRSFLRYWVDYIRISQK